MHFTRSSWAITSKNIQTNDKLKKNDDKRKYIGKYQEGLEGLAMMVGPCIVYYIVKDIAGLPPLKLASTRSLYVNKLQCDWLDQTVINLWPNGRLYRSKETQNDTFIPTIHLHEWISSSYVLKWENVEIGKICLTFHNAIERYLEKWPKKNPYQMF